MRALTVQQPWAWAIVHGGKSPENRSRNIAGSYRGPFALHVGLNHDRGQFYNPEVMRAYAAASGPAEAALVNGTQLGKVIAVVDLVSVHHDSDHGAGHPCSPWAFAGDWHLELANVRPLEHPIPARGRLGLWTPDSDLIAQLREQVTW